MIQEFARKVSPLSRVRLELQSIKAMKRSILVAGLLVVALTLSIRSLNRRPASDENAGASASVLAGSAAADTSPAASESQLEASLPAGHANFANNTTVVPDNSTASLAVGVEAASLPVVTTGGWSTDPLGELFQELQGSQTNRLPTMAAAFPPEHLAALLDSADEAEIVEESESEAAGTSESTPPSRNLNLVELQQRVTAATSADRQQVGFDLLTAFQAAPTDEAKVDLLAMAAELKSTPYSALLLQLGLAGVESDEVRVQAVFVAADLAPGLLPAYVNDSNEAVRDEVKAQLDSR